jgi:hypothetical protein
MPNDKKKVAALLPMSWSIRNVLTSGLADQVIARGVQLTLLPWRAEGLEALIPSSECVHIEKLLGPGPGRPTIGSTFLENVCSIAFQRRHNLHRQWRTFRRARQRKGLLPRFRSLLTEGLGSMCTPPTFYRGVSRFKTAAYRRENDLRPIYRQLESLRPDLIYSTVCVDGRERPYAMAAKDLGIPTLAAILSFDNLTSRGGIPTFDFYAVWNTRMRDRLLNMYPEVNPARVFTTGTPQFDFHRRQEFHWPEAETYGRLGLPAASRYILYASNHLMWTPTEPDFVGELARRLKQQRDLADVWIVVRLHPLDQAARWQHLSEQALNVVVSSPWTSPPDAQGWVVPCADDMRLLVSSLAHCGACVNMCSTIALDAAILDRPVIGIAFSTVPGSVEELVYLESYESLHYRPLVESGGLSLAHGWDELMSAVRKALTVPALDRPARRRMVETECGLVDGHATERVAETILTILRDGSKRTSAGIPRRLPGSR